MERSPPLVSWADLATWQDVLEVADEELDDSPIPNLRFECSKEINQQISVWFVLVLGPSLFTIRRSGFLGALDIDAIVVPSNETMNDVLFTFISSKS